MIKVEANRCKSCQMCIHFCPQKILELTNRLNDKGYHSIGLIAPDLCNSCGICALVCPDAAIEVST
jgi:2-oxoglutarate ferredoxin oxidoreductase subunit delta